MHRARGSRSAGASQICAAIRQPCGSGGLGGCGAFARRRSVCKTHPQAPRASRRQRGGTPRALQRVLRSVELATGVCALIGPRGAVAEAERGDRGALITALGLCGAALGGAQGSDTLEPGSASRELGARGRSGCRPMLSCLGSSCSRWQGKVPRLCATVHGPTGAGGGCPTARSRWRTGRPAVLRTFSRRRRQRHRARVPFGCLWHNEEGGQEGRKTRRLAHRPSPFAQARSRVVPERALPTDLFACGVPVSPSSCRFRPAPAAAPAPLPLAQAAHGHLAGPAPKAREEAPGTPRARDVCERKWRHSRPLSHLLAARCSSSSSPVALFIIVSRSGTRHALQGSALEAQEKHRKLLRGTKLEASRGTRDHPYFRFPS
ncbi:hypothetical protein CALCODRAFT_98266 [Calocera cornea HHB12733]|uniref:Uncharacterized protein n=1 Tax=Calocera cornea HHB12733 TaxID=1353952 RepID=A0A165IKJ6_9BASI|nr:hypothetical protein CALCODRAFT_98266 [Calocera cornea HHB12733]